MSKSARFHLISAIFWVPFTVTVFLLGLANSVALILLLSVYANWKTDWGAFHAARAQDDS